MRDDQLTIARPVQPLQVTNGGGAVAMTTKGREIVQPHQISRRDGHRIHVQGTRPSSDVASSLRLRTVGRRRQAVHVVSSQCREAGIETRWRTSNSENPDISGKEPA